MQKLRLAISFISMLTFLVSNIAFAQANKCPSGQFWDARVNRCMITMNNAEVKQESAACAGMSGDAFKECFNQNAANKVTELEDDDEMKHKRDFKKGNGTKIIVPLTITLITSYYLFINKDKFKNCKNTSLWLLFSAGAVSLVGEASAQITYKSKTKNLSDEYKEKMEDYKREKKYDIMTKNQAIAFDYLIEAEKARISAEKIRKGAYTLASLLYASTVAMAIVETAQVGFKQGASCTMTGAKTSSTSTVKSHYNKLAAINSEFSGYEHMESMTNLEFMEVLARKIYSNVFTASAYAQSNGNAEDNSDKRDLRKVSGIGDQDREDYVDTNTGFVYRKKEDGSYVKYAELIPGQSIMLDDPNGEPEDLEFTGKGVKASERSTLLDEVTVTACKDKTKIWDKESKSCVPDKGDFIEKVKKLTNSKESKSQLSKVDKAVATPWVRGALATVLGLYANKLRKDAKENIQISENRIGALEKMRDDFVASGGAGLQMCTESDRSNKEKPNCFCYNEDGNFDKSKSKLTICANLKKEFDMRMAKKYGWTHGEMAAVKVCVNEKNQMDTFCKCKSKKSSKGKGNSCAKISSSMNLSGLGGNSWLKGVVSPADSLLNGNLDGSQLDTASLNKKAMALNRKIAKMGKDPKYKSNFNKMKKNGLKLQNAHKAWFKKSFGNSMPKSLASMGGGATAAPTSIKDVMKQATKNLEKSKGVKYGTAGGAGASGGKKSNNLDFDWGSDSSEGGGVKVEEIAKVMDKNYAIKGDINKNPNHNIFKILSNRYQRSGLRRLFDTAGTSKADEANGSDINEK